MQRIRIDNNEPKETKVQIKNDTALKALADKASSVAEQIEAAPKFKTAEELGLTEGQLQSLVKTLEHLEAGKSPYIPTNLWRFCEKTPTGYAFHMSTWGANHLCGTVACIKGTADLLCGPKNWGLIRFDNSSISKLFFAGATSRGEWERLNISGFVEKITDQVAAKTLRGFLETGIVDWSHVK